MNEKKPLSHENRKNTLALELSLATSAFQAHVIELQAGDNILPSPAFKADGTSLAELTLKYLQSAFPNRNFSQASLAKLSPSELLWSWLSPGEVNHQRSASLVRSITHSAFDPAPGIENNAGVEALITLLAKHFASEHPATPIGLTPDIQQVLTDLIHGTPAPQPPDRTLSLADRQQRIDAFAARVRTSLANTEKGSQAQRNAHFMTLRPLTRPEGYFSAGLLAARLDPHGKTTVIYSSAVRSLSNEEHATSRYQRIYAHWEIAAGMHRHDEPDNTGSVLNVQYEQFKSTEDRQTVRELEALGQSLVKHWQDDVLATLDDEADAQAQRAGQADAYQVKAMLANLRRDTARFGKLPKAVQTAVNRTLDDNGQVIIPNVYGYPLEGYAFIPYQPYVEMNRPNRGLMLDLRNVIVSIIDGDDDFAQWARRHLGTLLQRFNSVDAQGGRDAHWPSAPSLMRTLMDSPSAHLELPVFQGRFAVRQAFNYTRAATSGYQLKCAPLDGIAALYARLNARNTQALSQTQVFSRAQQGWRTEEKVWASTFGYIPLVGNIGNIVFGIHDLNAGMSAEERLGGSVAILVSSLQLAHEVPAVVAGETTLGGAASREFGWRPTLTGNEWRFGMIPEESDTVFSDSVVEEGGPIEEPDAEEPAPVSYTITVTQADIVAQVKDDGSVLEQGGQSYIRMNGDVFQTRNSLLGPGQRTVIDPETENALFLVHNGNGKWEKLRGLAGGGQCFGRQCQSAQGEIEMQVQTPPGSPSSEAPASDTVLFALSKAQRVQALADEADDLTSWLSHDLALAEFKAVYTREKPSPHGFWGPARSYLDWQAIRRLVRDDAALLPLKDIEHPLPNEMLGEIRKHFINPPHPSLQLDDEASTRALFEKILVPPTAAEDMGFLLARRQALRLSSHIRRLLFKYGLTASQLRQLMSTRTALRDVMRTVIEERFPDLDEKADILFNSFEFNLQSRVLSPRKLAVILECLEDDSIATDKLRLIVQCIDSDAVPLPTSAVYLTGNTQKISLLKGLSEQQLRQRLEGASTLVDRSSDVWRRLKHRNYAIETSAQGEPSAILNWSFFKLKRTPILGTAGRLSVNEPWWPNIHGRRYATFAELERDLQHQFSGYRQTTAAENITLVEKPVLSPVSYEFERAPDGTPTAVFYRGLHDAQTKRMPIVNEAGTLFVVNTDLSWLAVSDRAFPRLKDLERAIWNVLIEPLSF